MSKEDTKPVESCPYQKKEETTSTTTTTTINSNTTATTKQEEDKPKPCCVCLDEKRARDECLMFKGFEDVECLKMIDQYKGCMKTFGFDI